MRYLCLGINGKARGSAKTRGFDFWGLLQIPVNGKATRRSKYASVKARICGKKSASRTNGKNRNVEAA